MTTYKQAPMFGHEDTPLFSGTAQVAKDSTFKPQPQVIEIQDSMFNQTQADKEFEYEQNVEYFEDHELDEVYLKNINKGLSSPYNTNTR